MWDSALLQKILLKDGTNFENIGGRLSEKNFPNLEIWASKVFETWAFPDLKNCINSKKEYSTWISYKTLYSTTFLSKCQMSV